MTKPEMISSIAERTGLKKVTIEKVVNELLEVVGDSLANGEEVNFIGFGKFTAKDTPSRVCRNPRTGEEVTVSDRKLIKFKAGKNLKDKVNG